MLSKIDWRLVIAAIALLLSFFVLFYGNGLCIQENPPFWIKPILTSICSPPQTQQPSSGEIKIWYAYGDGSAEVEAFSKIMDQAKLDLPNIKITVEQIEYDKIFNNYQTEVESGSGPDLIIVPNDNLGDFARNNITLDITDLASGKLNNYSQISLNGMSYNGRLYGIPEALKAVVFWYNKDMLSIPPVTTTDLQTLMENGTPIAVSYGCYHHFGFFGSYGGSIFDANWNFIADQGGVAEAMEYLKELYNISKANGWPMSDQDSLTPFIEGRVAAVLNGNWVMGDYKNALGNNLGVSPLPYGPGGLAKPLLGVDGFYINPNTTNKATALEVALYFTNKNSQTIMMKEAGHVPVNNTVQVTDPLIQNLIYAFANGYVRPQVSQMEKYWANFCDTDQVFEFGVSPDEWVRSATEDANK